MGSYWKNIERRVAEYFNTTRRKRGDDFSQSDCEIIADIATWLDNDKINGELIAECKYRSRGLGIVNLYNEIRNKEKTSLGFIGDDIIMVSLDAFKKVFLLLVEHRGLPIEDLGSFEVFQVKQLCPKYVNDFLNQARDYISESPTNDTRAISSLPILCCAKRGTKGIYAIFSIKDVQSFCKAEDSNRLS